MTAIPSPDILNVALGYGMLRRVGSEHIGSLPGVRRP